MVVLKVREEDFRFFWQDKSGSGRSEWGCAAFRCVSVILIFLQMYTLYKVLKIMAAEAKISSLLLSFVSS